MPSVHRVVDPVPTCGMGRPLGVGCQLSSVSCRPECRRLIHHQMPPPLAARASRSHGHQVVPVSGVGAWTVGLDESLGATVAVLGGPLVGGFGDSADEVGLIEAPRVVTVAVAVAVVVVVVVTVEELASVAVAGLDADVLGSVGDATLDEGGRVNVFDADGRDGVDGASLDADGRDGVDGATLDESERVGARVGVGEPGLDGRLTVGTGTVGSSDLVGVGSPEPLPPEPHPAAATTVISNAAATAIRMALPPQATLRLQHYRACHGRAPMDRTLVAGRARHLLGLQNQLPDSSCVDTIALSQQRRPIEPAGVVDFGSGEHAVLPVK